MKNEQVMGLGLILCDTIIEDRLTGKKSLIGMFDRLASQKFPCHHPQLSILVSLTSGRGAYPCSIICKHIDGDIAFQGNGKVDLQNPHQVVDIAFNFMGVIFPKPGVYNLQFLADDFPVMTRQIFIEQATKKD